MIFIDESDSLSHYGVLGMHWGVRKDGKPQGFQYGKDNARSRTDISNETYAKLNKVYRSMPLADRRMIDPDISDKPEDYFNSEAEYKDKTAFNLVTDDGFIIAEKIPEEQNINGTRGLEIGAGVLTKGKGVGTELTKGLCEWFDNQSEYDVIWWPVDPDNAASIRIAEKNGFIKDPLGTNWVYATDEGYRRLDI